MFKIFKAIAAVLDVVPGWLYAIALAIALGGIGVHKGVIASLRADIKAEQNQRTADEAQAKIDKETAKTDQATAVAAALATAKTESDRLQKDKDDVLRKANTQLIAKTADASRARSELASLRNQAADDRVRLSRAAKQAVVDYAATASELLNECSQRYQELADKADGHAIDAGMIEGWPVMKAISP